MSRILFRFQTRYPDIDLTFSDVASVHQINMIKEGSLDVGFLRLPVDDDLESHTVVKDRLAFVFPVTMIQEISGFDSEAVRSLPFLGLHRRLAPGVDDYIQRLFRSRDFQPKVMHRVNESLTLLFLVASGLGVAVMHESALQRVVNLIDGVAVRPITDAIASWDVGLVWRRNEQNPVVIHFLRVAKEVLSEDVDKGSKVWPLPRPPARRLS